MIPPLPSIFTPSAIDSITWKLNPESCPPLQYQSLKDLVSIRSSPGSRDNILADMGVLEHISDLASVPSQKVSSKQDSEAFFFGRIALALLLLGHGYTDECHNIVTPLSWPEDIAFAHGPSLFASASPSVRAHASYTHSLVHQKEALNVGELGLMGLENAEFWINMVKRSGPEGVDSLPHDEWKQGIKDLAADAWNSGKIFSTNPQVQAWIRKRGLVSDEDKDLDGYDKDRKYFDSRAMLQLCSSMLQTDPSKLDPDFQNFAEEAVGLEVRILLKNALKLAGMLDENT